MRLFLALLLLYSVNSMAVVTPNYSVYRQGPYEVEGRVANRGNYNCDATDGYFIENDTYTLGCMLINSITGPLVLSLDENDLNYIRSANKPMRCHVEVRVSAGYKGKITSAAPGMQLGGSDRMYKTITASNTQQCVDHVLGLGVSYGLGGMRAIGPFRFYDNTPYRTTMEVSLNGRLLGKVDSPSGGGNGGYTPPSCDVFTTDVDFGALSPNQLNGALSSSPITVQCSGSATMSISLLNNGTDGNDGRTITLGSNLNAALCLATTQSGGSCYGGARGALQTSASTTKKDVFLRVSLVSKGKVEGKDYSEPVILLVTAQ